MNLAEKKKFLVEFAFAVALFLIIFFSLKFALVYLFPFIIGAIIAYVVQKPAEFIATKTHVKKQLCAAVLSVMAYVAVCLCLIAIVWLSLSKTDSFIEYITSLGSTFEEISDKINGYINKFYSGLGSNFQTTFERVINDAASGFVSKIVVFISNGVTSVIKNIPALFATALITVVASCYIAKDYDKLKKFLRGIISEKIYKNAVTIKNIFTDSILKFAFGYFKIMLITFLELLIGFFILGTEHFFITALLISIIDLLPIIGTGTVLLPWSVILFLQSNYKLGFGIVILYIIICIVRNFLEPRIIGKQIGINPIFTLVSMFVGLKMAGIVGIIVFPVALIVAFTFYRNKFC